MREGLEETLSVSAVSIAERGGHGARRTGARARREHLPKNAKNSGRTSQKPTGVAQNNRLSGRGPHAESGGVT